MPMCEDPCGDEGDSDDNVYALSHAQAAFTLGQVEFWLRRHHGDLNVDTVSEKVGRAAWKPLRDAILASESDAAVNVLGRAAFGASWWNTNIASVPDAFAALRVQVIAAYS